MHREMDNILDLGTSTLYQVREQRTRLISTRSKLLDSIQQMSLSRTVMRLIEKRAYSDKIILFGGMIAFTIFMLLVVYYFKYTSR